MDFQSSGLFSQSTSSFRFAPFKERMYPQTTLLPHHPFKTSNLSDTVSQIKHYFFHPFHIPNLLPPSKPSPLAENHKLLIPD